MHIEDKTGKSIKIMVNTFGNKAGDFVEITDSDQKGVFYKDGKGKRCRFLHTQAGMLFRYEDQTDEDIQKILNEAAETEPEPAVKETADETADEAEEPEEGESSEEPEDEPEDVPEKAPKKAKSKK